MRTPTLFLAPLALAFAGGLGFQSAAFAEPAANSASIEDPITWEYLPFDGLLRKSEDTERPVLVYFWINGSSQCGSFYTDTLQNEEAATPSANFLCFSADHGTQAGGQLFERYNITTVPAIRVIDSKGEAIDGINGYASVAVFATELNRIAKSEGTLPTLLDQVSQAPSDLPLRNLLAGKYLDLGNQAKHDDLQDSIRKEDPTGKTIPGASLLLNDTINAATEKATGPKSIDIKSVYALANRLEEQDAAFRCWNWIAFVESARGDSKKEWAALHQAWPLVKSVNARRWGQTQAQWMLGMSDQLSKADKALVLSMARGKPASATEEGELCTIAGCTQSCCAELSKSAQASQMAIISQALFLNDLPEEARVAAAKCSELDPETARGKTLEAAFDSGSCNIATEHYNDTRPVWSPNGKQVLFTSNRDGNQELYMANVKKGTAKRLTRTQCNETSGSFDPKGKNIAYNCDAFGAWTIYTMNNKGKNKRILQPMDSLKPVALSDASYSPDGKHIAYTTTANGKNEIVVARLKGGDEKTLTVAASHGDRQPIWSGKSGRIVYASARDNQAGIFSMKADGSDIRNLATTPEGCYDADATTSVDGKRVLFTRWQNETCDIYSMGADGKGLVNLTQANETDDRRPQLSPNGKQILFERGSNDGPTRLWLMDANGSNPHQLLQ